MGPGVSPATALAVGLKVDADALPASLVAQVQNGAIDLTQPAITLALLQLNAVVGVTGFFNPNGSLKSIGIQCAMCHSTVDRSFTAPGIPPGNIAGAGCARITPMAPLTLALALACSFTALAADQPPKLRLVEVQNVAPERYRAELTLDPDKTGFSGDIRIQVKVSRPAQTIWLNANRIAVQQASVTAGGKTLTAKALAGGDDFLGLQLPSAIPAGAAEIAIRYTGEVRHGDSSGVFHAEDGGVSYILTQFEATDARDAFPCFDEPSYKVPWQLTLRIPPQDEAVSNTPAASETSESGMRKIAFAETKPLSSYLIAFAVGPLEFVDAGFAGKKHVPVRIVTPKGRAGEAKYAAEVTATILTRLEDYFGIPFP